VALDAPCVAIGELDFGYDSKKTGCGLARGFVTPGQRGSVPLDADEVGQDDRCVSRQFAPPRYQLQSPGLGQEALVKDVGDQPRELGRSGCPMGKPKQVDHPATGVPAKQGGGKRSPGGLVLAAGKQAIAIDRPCQGLRLAAQRVDDTAIVHAMDTHAVPTPELPSVGDDPGSVEEGLDPIVVDMNPQPLVDELGGHRIEDGMHQEAAGLRDAGDNLDDTGSRPPRH